MSEYDPIKAVDMADARDAVIEAAKVYMELLPDHPQGRYAYDNLEIAVDALLAAEKGEQ